MRGGEYCVLCTVILCKQTDENAGPSMRNAWRRRPRLGRLTNAGHLMNLDC